MSHFEHPSLKNDEEELIDPEEARMGLAIDIKENELNSFRHELARVERELAERQADSGTSPQYLEQLQKNISECGICIKDTEAEYATLIGKRAEYLHGRKRPPKPTLQ